MYTYWQWHAATENQVHIVVSKQSTADSDCDSCKAAGHAYVQDDQRLNHTLLDTNHLLLATHTQNRNFFK